MAGWRRRARALFPELSRELSEGDYSPYGLFGDLRSRLRAANERADEEELARIYAFAEWCLRQREKALWNPAGVSFYEHLFDPDGPGAAAVPWISPFVIERCTSLWQWRLPPEEFGQVMTLLARCSLTRHGELDPDPGTAGGAAGRGPGALPGP